MWQKITISPEEENYDRQYSEDKYGLDKSDRYYLKKEHDAIYIVDSQTSQQTLYRKIKHRKDLSSQLVKFPEGNNGSAYKKQDEVLKFVMSQTSNKKVLEKIVQLKNLGVTCIVLGLKKKNKKQKYESYSNKNYYEVMPLVNGKPLMRSNAFRSLSSKEQERKIDEFIQELKILNDNGNIHGDLYGTTKQTESQFEFIDGNILYDEQEKRIVAVDCEYVVDGHLDKDGKVDQFCKEHCFKSRTDNTIIEHEVLAMILKQHVKNGTFSPDQISRDTIQAERNETQNKLLRKYFNQVRFFGGTYYSQGVCLPNGLYLSIRTAESQNLLRANEFNQCVIKEIAIYARTHNSTWDRFKRTSLTQSLYARAIKIEEEANTNPDYEYNFDW